MLDARFLHFYFCQSLNRLQRGLSAIAELLVSTVRAKIVFAMAKTQPCLGAQKRKMAVCLLKLHFA